MACQTPYVLTPDDWCRARQPGRVVHLDAAACGRPSSAVLAATVAHLTAEAEGGAYVAEVAAEQTGPAPEGATATYGTIARGRERLGALVGLGGPDVAFAEGAGVAFAVLLAAWPLGRGARVGALQADYGANRLVLERLAHERGWQVVPLPVDDAGRITGVPDRLDLVTYNLVASQDGIVQPAVTGVPVVLDVAQALGQTALPRGCAAYVGTSRKWLCGPRGVGFAVVDPAFAGQLTAPPTLATGSGAGLLDSTEANIAGRVGLAIAADEWSPELLPVVHARAAELRQALAATPWRVREPVGEPSGTTTLAGGDPVAARSALLAAGLLTSAVPVTRAYGMKEPVLRISTHAWVTEGDIATLVGALSAYGLGA